MLSLNTISRRIAYEIRTQDWSDAHVRADGARHNRVSDRTRSPQLSPEETDLIRLNVIWVVGQALLEDDPNFDVREFAKAAGASNYWLYRKNGAPNHGVEAGLRGRGGYNFSEIS